MPRLQLSADEIINGWETESTVYFFVPSYITSNTVSLDHSLKWQSTEAAHTTLRYDTVQELLFYNSSGTLIHSKNICFKHSANLHTIYMDLKECSLDSVTKDDFVKAAIKVVSPDGSVTYNEPDNFVKGRGNSTWETEKKPFYIKLQRETGLCGMEPDKKWLLMANAFDASKLLNKLFYDFSKQAGIAFSADSEWADLYVNGEYQGNYLVCEKIDVGKNRIDVGNLEKENETVFPSSPSNISGGYIIEKDVSVDPPDHGFTVDKNNRKCFVITSPDNATEEEIAYIKSYFQNIQNLLSEQDEAVFQFIDADSFARRFLIEEAALNSDAFITSCYFYKKRNDDKIYAGPIWDFDSVLGESNVVDRKEMGNVWLNYDETTILSMNDNRTTTAVLRWDEQLYNMPVYQTLLKETYVEIRPLFEILLNENIDACAEKIRQSAALDSIRWDYGKTETGHYSSYDNNIRYMKFFLAKRINFLNRRFGLAEISYDNATAEMHEITCITENGEIKMAAQDGSLLKESELPAYDKTKYNGWIYAWDHTPVSEYLPVYESMTLLLQPKTPTQTYETSSKMRCRASG